MPPPHAEREAYNGSVQFYFPEPAAGRAMYIQAGASPWRQRAEVFFSTRPTGPSVRLRDLQFVATHLPV